MYNEKVIPTGPVISLPDSSFAAPENLTSFGTSVDPEGSVSALL
jgi:hypothetical protein